MNETSEELKARLLLERQTGGVFRLFFQHAPTLIGHEFTILAFDQDNRSEHVAYKTSLSPEWLIRTFERLIASWSGEEKIYAPPGLSPLLLRDLAKAIKNALPPTVGFAIVIGLGERLAYVGSGERASVGAMIERQLLPQWRKELVS